MAVAAVAMAQPPSDLSLRARVILTLNDAPYRSARYKYCRVVRAHARKHTQAAVADAVAVAAAVRRACLRIGGQVYEMMDNVMPRGKVK